MPEFLIKPEADTDFGNAIFVSGADPVSLDAGSAPRGVALRVFQLTASASTLTFPEVNNQLADVTTTDTLTHRGVTFTFDRPMPTVRSCLDEPCVISSEPFSIVSISPEAQAISGPKGSFVANGTMLDPGALDIPNAQGFEGLVGENDASGQGASALPYSAALNVDPGVNGTLAFAQGSTGSVVKAVRKTGVTATIDGTWQTIDRYVVLSVLDAVPQEGFFRPGMGPGTKTIYGREADVNYSVLRDLNALTGSVNQAEAEARIMPTSPFFGMENAEQVRRLDLEEAGPAGSNYSLNFGLTRADAHGFLHENRTIASKRLVALRSIQHGIDLAQAQANGYLGFGGAGQHYGRSFFSYFAAFALNSTSLLSAAQALGGAALRQHYWALPEDIGLEVGFPDTSDGNRFESPLVASDLGIPEWDRQPGDPVRRDASPRARYREMWPAGMMEALNVALLQNGPGGISGVDAILAGGAFDETNPFAAALAFYDRVAVWPTDAQQTNLYVANLEARWSARRPFIDLAPWTGRPDWIEDGDKVSAGSGQISYDWTGHTWATETITRRDVRHSLDGLQWVEQQNVLAAGTLLGLTPGLAHHVSFRLVSASGPGRWTPTYAQTTSSGLRNVVTPGGTQTAAVPSNTLQPRILVRALENWGGSDMVDAGASYSAAQYDDNITLYAGLGYWIGFPAPTFSYQWQANGVDLPGETGQSLSLAARFELSEQSVTCVIGATNSQGTVTATTQAITLPFIAPPGMIRFDFGAGDASAGWTAEAGTTIAYSAGEGALVVNPTGAWTGTISPALTTVPGTQYTISMFLRNTNGTLDVEVGTTPGGNDVLSNGSRLGLTGTPVELTETVTALGTEVYVNIRRRGAGAGADFYVESLEMNPAT